MRTILALILALSLAAPARAQDIAAPTKSLPTARLTAAVDTGPIGVPETETAATIQARLDDLKPGQAVSFQLATLDRPLQLDRDRAALVGLPKGLLKTTGPFPGLILSPPTRRFPGFPARCRVGFGWDGAVGVGLDLSAARLTLRATAFERLPQGASKLTIAALIARKGETWGNNGTAPLLTTETDRLGYEPLRLVVDTTRIMLDFKTEDGASHRAWFKWPGGDRLGLIVEIDGDSGKVAAWANGVSCTPMTDPLLRPGSRIAQADFPDMMSGWCPYSGQGSFLLGGLRVSPRLVHPIDAPAITGTDAALYGPSNHGSDASLDLTVPMADDSDWCVWYRVRGKKLGCGVLVPAKWSPWDVTSRIEVRDLEIEVGDNDYGQAIWSGPCLRLKLRDVTMTGGARGFDQHPQIVSYRSSLTGLSFYRQSEVAMHVGKGIVWVDDANFDPSPKRCHVRWHSAGGSLEHFFMAEGQAPIIMDIRAFIGHLRVADGEMNREVEGPDSYIRVRRESMGKGGAGRVAVLEVDGVDVGAQPAGRAVVDMDDSLLKGRTELGTARVEVRRSFGLLRPDAKVFNGVSAGWGAESDGIRVGPEPIPVSGP